MEGKGKERAGGGEGKRESGEKGAYRHFFFPTLSPGCHRRDALVKPEGKATHATINPFAAILMSYLVMRKLVAVCPYAEYTRPESHNSNA